MPGEPPAPAHAAMAKTPTRVATRAVNFRSATAATVAQTAGRAHFTFSLPASPARHSRDCVEWGAGQADEANSGPAISPAAGCYETCARATYSRARKR
jgi:hypothetical protein